MHGSAKIISHTAAICFSGLTGEPMATISDREIWHAASSMIMRHGEVADTKANFRADHMLVECAAERYAISRRIIEAVDGLSGTEPGGKVN